jgi:hypothetical protein
MSLECVIVIAHAMGRTLVVPPQQHLYLLGQTHKDKDSEQPNDEVTIHTPNLSFFFLSLILE